MFASLHRFSHCYQHHSGQVLATMSCRSSATVTGPPFQRHVGECHGRRRYPCIAVLWKRVEPGLCNLLVISQGRSKRRVTQQKVARLVRILGGMEESHQSWPGRRANPVCPHRFQRMHRPVSSANAWSRLSLKPGKLWVDSGLR